MEQSKTTRDELVKAIADGRECGGHYNCGAFPEEITEAGRDLDAYLNAYAHQLAEVLRAEAERFESRIPEVDRTVRNTTRIRALRYAADLIDPQAQRTTEPVPAEPKLTVRYVTAVVPACPNCANPAHPWDTCAEVEQRAEMARGIMDAYLAQALKQIGEDPDLLKPGEQP